MSTRHRCSCCFTPFSPRTQAKRAEAICKDCVEKQRTNNRKRPAEDSEPTMNINGTSTESTSKSLLSPRKKDRSSRSHQDGLGSLRLPPRIPLQKEEEDNESFFSKEEEEQLMAIKCNSTDSTSSLRRRSKRQPKKRDFFHTKIVSPGKCIDEILGLDQPGGVYKSPEEAEYMRGVELFDELKEEGWTYRKCAAHILESNYIFVKKGVPKNKMEENVNFFTSHRAIFLQYQKDGETLDRILERANQSVEGGDKATGSDTAKSSKDTPASVDDGTKKIPRKPSNSASSTIPAVASRPTRKTNSATKEGSDKADGTGSTKSSKGTTATYDDGTKKASRKASGKSDNSASSGIPLVASRPTRKTNSAAKLSDEDGTSAMSSPTPVPMRSVLQMDETNDNYHEMEGNSDPDSSDGSTPDTVPSSIPDTVPSSRSNSAPYVSRPQPTGTGILPRMQRIEWELGLPANNRYSRQLPIRRIEMMEEDWGLVPSETFNITERLDVLESFFGFPSRYPLGVLPRLQVIEGVLGLPTDNDYVKEKPHDCIAVHEEDWGLVPAEGSSILERLDALESLLGIPVLQDGS